MTDPVITDLRRELEKALETLLGCGLHLARHAEMNAALHCAERVMYSPLHAKVEAATAGIAHALKRTEQPTVPTLDSRSPEGTWAALVADLDRCQHGRHQGDACGCGSCGGTSRGNPILPPGTVIGYGLRGERIIMPLREDKHDPAAWRSAPTDAAAAIEPDNPAVATADADLQRQVIELTKQRDRLVREHRSQREYARAQVIQLFERAEECGAAIARVRTLHRPVTHRGLVICTDCSSWDGGGDSTDNSPVLHAECPTIAALDGPPAPADGLPPAKQCTRHTGAERQLYGCTGPDPTDTQPTTADDPTTPDYELREALLVLLSRAARGVLRPDEAPLLRQHVEVELRAGDKARRELATMTHVARVNGRAHRIAYQASVEAHAAVARMGQMASAWEQQLPLVIRTATVVDAVRTVTEGLLTPADALAEQRAGDLSEEHDVHRKQLAGAIDMTLDRSWEQLIAGAARLHGAATDAEATVARVHDFRGWLRRRYPALKTTVEQLDAALDGTLTDATKEPTS